MTRMWCINCQAEREHIYFHGQEECKGNCEHLCSTCQRETLASIQPNANDAGYSEIKQMVGEAQRIAQRTGKKGDIEVVKDVGVCGSNYQAQVLVYNTYTQHFRVSKR
jgi:hypothetical protein